MKTIKNLAFKGGGVLGIAYAGAIKVLEDNKILDTVEKVSGTSAGAITAALLSLRYNASEIYTIVQSTNFADFEDNKKDLRVFTKYGIYAGATLLQFIQKQITNKGLPATATFKDFHDKGMRDLYVFATDLNTQGLQEFSYSKTPNTIVAEAIRASMSIPLFFGAWTFSNGIPNKHIYVDGGMIYNFPISIFDTGSQPNPETMGLFLSNISGPQPVNNLGYDHLFEYTKILFETMMNAQVINFLNNDEQKARTANIDNLGISATNFNLTDAQKQQLFDSGVKYTKAFVQQKLLVAAN